MKIKSLLAAMMKRFFSCVFVAIACCTTLCASDNNNRDSWHVMLGNGYSVMLGDMLGEGYSSVNSFAWQPSPCWGFGLEYGMNYHNPVDYSLQRDYDYQGTTINYQYTRRHNNFFVGPSIYWYPVNTQKHRVHIGGSVNYFHTNDFNQYREFDTDNQQYISERSEEIVVNSIGLGVSTGYSYKLGNHLEFGARFYTSWSQEEFHLMGLFNIGFGF